MNFFHAISNLLRFDRTNWKALAMCFLGAGVFWIFNALNKNYSTNLNYPVQFQFDQSHYIAVDPPPSYLTINVQSNGWNLLRKSLGLKVTPILVQLERPSETKKIVAASLAPLVASQLGTLTMNYIVSDTIRMKIEPKSGKRVHITADLSKMNFRKGLGLVGPITITPDTAWLEGPRSMIEEINDTLQVQPATARVGKSFRENVELVVVNNELIRRNPPVVEVAFNVGPVLERSASIILQLPMGISADQDSIHLQYTVPEQELENLDWSAASASVGIVTMNRGESTTVLPILTGLPAQIQLKQLDSVKVRKR